MLGDDLSTNYQLLPGDRLVARPRVGRQAREPATPPPAATARIEAHARFWPGRPFRPFRGKPRHAETGGRRKGQTALSVQRLENRIDDMEHKLDQILESLARRHVDHETAYLRGMIRFRGSPHDEAQDDRQLSRARDHAFYGVRSSSSQGEGIKAVRNQPRKAPSPRKELPVPPFALRDDYVVEPPDLIFVSLEEGLPGRPTLRRPHSCAPDGTISLGWYGDVEVAGLTVAEIKEKIIARLQKFLRDEHLGLIAARRRWPGQWSIPRPESRNGSLPETPRKSALRSRNATARSSTSRAKCVHLAASPLRARRTYSTRLTSAGGPSPTANLEHVLLYRENSQGEPDVYRRRRESARTSRNSGNRLFSQRRRPSGRPSPSSDAGMIQPARSLLSRPHPLSAPHRRTRDGLSI